MTLDELAGQIANELLRKSGVQEWLDPLIQQQIGLAARNIAYIIQNGVSEPPDDEDSYSLPPDDEECDDMALPDHVRLTNATPLTFKSSGGTAVITLTSLANAAGRQSDKLDLGANRAERYRVTAAMEIAATPTAGAAIDLYWAPSTSGTAGTDNPGGIGGADAAYAGYSSNLTASLKQLLFIGSMVTTTQATATVQAAWVGTFVPPTRYGTLVVVNNSGAALHSSATNMNVTLIPDGTSIEDTI